MSKVYRLTADEAVAKLKSLVQSIYKQYGYRTSFKRSLPCGYGGSSHYVNDEHIMNVGVQQLYGFGASFSKRFATNAFIDTVITLFHEVGHRFQYDLIEKYGVSSCPNIVDSMAAAESSSLYYIRNNAVLAHEISAEAIGVTMAYDYFAELIGDETTQQLMKNYLIRSSRSSQYPLAIDCVQQFDREGIISGFSLYYKMALSLDRNLPIAKNGYEKQQIYGMLEHEICENSDVTFIDLRRKTPCFNNGDISPEWFVNYNDSCYNMCNIILRISSIQDIT